MKILVCDDHALFRAGLQLVLRELDADAVLLEASSVELAIEIVEAQPDLDLVLLDLELPGMDGLAGLRTLRERYPAIPVVMVSASERQSDVRAAVDGGASGFIPKSSTAPVLLAALRLVLSGGVYVPPLVLAAEAAQPAPADDDVATRAAALSPRQLEVLELLARGKTNREICAALGIAEGTAKAHVATILDTLGVTNRAEAAAALHRVDRPRSPDAPRAAGAPGEYVFRREGDYWTVVYDGAVCRLRDGKGVHYLAFLLRHPGRECHALEIVAEGRGHADALEANAEPSALPAGHLGDAGALLDPQARAAYRRRLRELDDEREAARATGNAERATRIDEEVAFLAREVAGAVGLGGRERRAGSAAERARQSVTRALRVVVERLGDGCPELASHLDRSLKTGTFCAYMPDPSSPVRWTF